MSRIRLRAAAVRAGLVTGSRALSALLTLVVGLLVARSLGAEGSGSLYLALSVASLGGSLAAVGPSDPVMRKVAVAGRDKATAGAVVRAALSATFPASLIACAGGGLLLLLLLEDFQSRSLYWALAAIPGFAYTQILFKALTGTGRPLLGELTTRAGVQLVLIVGVLIIPGAIWWLGVAVAAAYWIPAVVAIVAWNRLTSGGGPRRSVDKNIRADLLRQGLPLVFMTSITVLPQWLDVLLISAMVGVGDAGIYGASVRVAALLGLLVVGAQAIAGPRFAQLHESGKVGEIQRIAGTVNLYMAVTAAVVAVCLAAVAPVVLGLFGVEFREGASALRISLIGQVVNCSVGLVGIMLIMIGRGGQALIASSAGLAVNLVLNLALIPLLEIDGAAIASTAAAVVSNFIAAYFVWRNLGIRPLSLRIRSEVKRVHD